MKTAIKFIKPDLYYGIVAINGFRSFRVNTLKQSPNADSLPEVDQKFSWEDKSSGRKLVHNLERLGDTTHSVVSMQGFLQQMVPRNIKYPLPIVFESGDFLEESAESTDPVLCGLRENQMVEIVARKLQSISRERHVFEPKGKEGLLFSALFGDGSDCPHNIVKLDNHVRFSIMVNDKVDSVLESPQEKKLPDPEMFDVILDHINQRPESGERIFNIYADPADHEFLEAITSFIRERANAKGINPERIKIIPSSNNVYDTYDEALKLVMAEQIKSNKNSIDVANENPEQFLEQFFSKKD